MSKISHQKIFILILCICLGIYLLNNKTSLFEQFSDITSSKSDGVVRGYEDEELEYGNIDNNNGIELPDSSTFISSNLLPKDDPKLDDSFTEFSPANDMKGQNFIDSNKYSIGLQSQSLRNANLQLRSDPPITDSMHCESPWNNSTIYPEKRETQIQY